MKLRSLLSLEGIGLESNRSSALTEYGCEQVIGSLACKLSPLSPGGLTWMCRKMSKLNFVGSLSALRSSVAMWEGRGDPTSPYNLRLPTIYTGDDSLLTRNVSENIEKLIDSPRSQPRSVKIGEGSACSLSPGSPYTPSPQSPAR